MGICRINSKLLINTSEIAKIYYTKPYGKNNHKVIMDLKSSKLSGSMHYLETEPNEVSWNFNSEKDAENFIDQLYNTIQQCK
jgi:hypothetical protein